MKYLKHISLGCVLGLSILTNVEACTRVIYEGCDDKFITARSMDWKEDIPTSLWIFPRGMKRNGGIDTNSIQWTSRYGSIITSGYNIATDDGINEEGLVANLLYLVESDYGTSNKPTISIGAITQYVLDNYATVKEAVEGLKNTPMQIIAPDLPGGEKSGLHLAISDKKGDSAVVESIKGKLTIHSYIASKMSEEDRKNKDLKYKTMTNSPTFDKQLAINSYWEGVQGMEMLPGTNRSPDRFARANFYTNSIEQNCTVDINNTTDKIDRTSLATAFSIIRNASVPIGVTDKEKPNIASTLWRTVADQKKLRYYFDSATSPFVLWVDIDDVNLSEGAFVKTLNLENYPMNYEGNVSSEFINAEPFPWLKPKDEEK